MPPGDTIVRRSVLDSSAQMDWSAGEAQQRGWHAQPYWSKQTGKLVDVTGIEPVTPCLQTRFRHFLKLMEFCWFQVIGYQPLVRSRLRTVET
jgi:hypothetical protein